MQACRYIEDPSVTHQAIGAHPAVMEAAAELIAEAERRGTGAGSRRAGSVPVPSVFEPPGPQGRHRVSPVGGP